jgi:hypothetical protein
VTTTEVADPWDESPCGLATTALDGTILAANRTFREWVGRDRQSLEGAVRLSELLSVGGRVYWETHLAPALHAEGRVDEVALELSTPHGYRPVLVTAVVRPGPAHTPGIVHVALSSARERSRYERELLSARSAADRSATQVRALQAATVALAQALGLGGVVSALLSAAVGPLGASAATVWLLDGRDLLEPAGSLGEPAAGAPLPLRSGLEGRAAVAESGRFVVGLHGQAGLQGALSLAPSTDPLDPLDPEVVTAVALQAGLALDRARLYEQSATVAHELQHSLLAATPPVDPRFEIAAAYRPGVEALDVGGDWHDAFLADDGVLALVVGDVVGRGLRAASAMGQLRSAVRAVAGPGVGPARLLSRLDRFVGQVEDAAMATLVYAELDLSTGRMRYACAGHPPPLLLRATGEPQLLWDGRSTPLGVVRPGVERTESEVTLGSGDRLLLYTDGLVERRDRRLEDSLQSLAAAACAVSDLPPDAAVPSLMETLLRDERGRDDVCLLLLLWLGDPAITSAAGPDGR